MNPVVAAFIIATAAMSAPVAAQTVPSIEDDAPAPPGVGLLAGKEVDLTPREQANVARARRFVDDAPDLVTTGEEGAVVFEFGTSYPTIVCAVLAVCDVQLQTGEVVQDVNIGDSARWKIKPALSGVAPSATTHVLIKPTDVGLVTNLVVMTDRRTYRMKLVSRKEDFMPLVRFSYPDEEAAAWAAYAAAATATPAPAAAMAVESPTGGALDFGYRIRGDKPRWRPVRAYSDGAKTYVQMPKAMAASEAPVLVVMGRNGSEELVNYRLQGDRFVIDKVIDEAMLVDGVGRHQVRVSIERVGE